MLIKWIEKLLRFKICRMLQFEFWFRISSYEILKKMNKISNLNLEKVKKAVKIIKSNKMFFRTEFILGFPGETFEQVKESLKLLKEVKPDFFRVQFFVPILSRSYLELKSRKMITDENIDEFHTGAIKIKTKVNKKILRKIWIKYARLSD